MRHSEQPEFRCNHLPATTQRPPIAEIIAAQEEGRVDPLRYKSAEHPLLRIIQHIDFPESPFRISRAPRTRTTNPSTVTTGTLKTTKKTTPKLEKDLASSAHDIPSKGIMLRFHSMYVSHQSQFYFCTTTLCPNPLPYALCPESYR